MGLRGTTLIVAALGVLWLAGVTAASDTTGEEAARIGHEELKAMLGSSDLLIVDVRAAPDWEQSDIKIKGAIREDPKRTSEWFSKYPKDKTIVFYCA